MPAQPPVINTVKATVHGVLPPGRFDNVFHLQYTGPAPSAADCITLATDVLNDYNAAFLGLIPASNGSTTGCDIVDLSSQTSAEGSVSLVSAFTGTGTPMPSSVACVISWHINLRYRGGHARSYIPGGSHEQTSSYSAWTPAYTTSMNAAATTFRTAMNAIAIGGTTYKLAVVSYTSGGLPRPTPFVLLVNGNSVHGRIDTQRRRLGKETP